MYTLDQVRCFMAVAEELHFGRAAEKLGMTQPPLSRQIQRLEHSLRVTLLERDHRNVHLTPAGQAFYRESQGLLAAVERAPEVARKVASGFEGVVRLGFTAAAGFGVLGELLTLLAQRVPGVQIELEELVTGAQVSALESHRLDLGLGRPPVDAERFNSELLRAEDLMLAVPAGARIPLADGVVAPETFRDMPLVMHSPQAARYFHELCVRLFPVERMRTVHTTDQIPTMMALVRAGLGCAFVPASATHLGSAGVELLDLGESAHRVVELHAMWMKDNRNPALRRVLEAVAQWMREDHQGTNTLKVSPDSK